MRNVNFLGALVLVLALQLISHAEAASRAVGTTSDSHITQFPYEVSIRRRFCDACAYEHYCSGAIYSDHVVITAASCLKDAQVHRTHVVAATTKRSASAQDGQIYLIEKIMVHENSDIDIALLHLATEFKFNDLTLAPVTLATDQPKAGERAMVAGWGQLSEFEANFEDNLKAVQVPIMDLVSCREAYFWTNVKDTEICAGYPQGGVDTCQGDAGSPLMVHDKMVGLVSWGYGCARAGNPGVYTNVVMLRDWIVANA